MMELNIKERIILVKLVKEEIRKGQMEAKPKPYFDGRGYTKRRKKYGSKTLETLYELETKLFNNGR